MFEVSNLEGFWRGCGEDSGEVLETRIMPKRCVLQGIFVQTLKQPLVFISFFNVLAMLFIKQLYVLYDF